MLFAEFRTIFLLNPLKNEQNTSFVLWLCDSGQIGEFIIPYKY